MKQYNEPRATFEFNIFLFLIWVALSQLNSQSSPTNYP